MYEGILLVDKPAGWTSFDVVNYVRKMVAQTEGKKPKQIKVGHTGTLDPFATGLLIILVGKKYTRRASEFSKLDKTYEVTMRLGATSTTGDPEGEITPISDRKPSKEEINATLSKFVGKLEQVPPAYSAIKINGQRAYKLARKGHEVILKVRKVKINRIKLVNYLYPKAELEVSVSSGTYIRALVEDLGSYLCVGSYTISLKRTSIGNFSINQASRAQDLDIKTLPSAILNL